MKKLLMLLFVLPLMFAQNVQRLENGNNQLLDNDLSPFIASTADSTPWIAIDSTHYTAVYTPYIRDGGGNISMDFILDSVATTTDGIQCSVFLYEGNRLGEYNLKTLVCVVDSAAGATFDTTVELSLFPTRYFRIGFKNFGGDDTIEVDTSLIYRQW